MIPVRVRNMAASAILFRKVISIGPIDCDLYLYHTHVAAMLPKNEREQLHFVYFPRKNLQMLFRNKMLAILK